MSVDAVGARVAELKAQLKRERPRPPATIRRPQPATTTKSLPRAAIVGTLKIIAVVVLPFLICVRGSVSLYMGGASTTVAIASAAAVALCMIAWYAASLSRRLTGRARFTTMIKWVALPLVVGWCGYALFYLASTNAKTDDVRRSYTAVHPILRFALSTLILADGDLVVTDMKRLPEDYRRMGLPVFDRTLHYKQADGWVHAVDLRTNGHGERHNRAVQLYFQAMGFRTLRHVGTSDHLHVQLPNR